VDTEETDKRIQRQRIDELRTQQTTILDELSQLTTANLSRLDDKIEKLASDINTRQAQIELLNRELETLKSRKKQLVEELSRTHNVTVEHLQSQLEEKKRRYSEITQQVELITQQIRDQENQTFADFLSKFGLDDSVTFEEKYIQGLENLADKKNKLETQKVKLSRRLDYEYDSLQAARERLKILSAEIASAEQSSLSLLEEEESSRKKLEQLERQVTKLRLDLQTQSKS